jgi:nucleoside-diphosphate-sugar epimerase
MSKTLNTFLVTGAMGFVGSHLVERLLKDGKTVWGIDLSEPPYREDILKHPNFHFVLDTIMNEEVLETLIDKADCVCHLAAIANPATYVKDPFKVMEITLRMGLRVVSLAQMKGKLVFYTSTSEVYGKNPNVPFHEDDDRVLGSTAVNRWCYSTSKAACEHFMLAAHQRGHLDFVIVRLFNIYGPRLRERVVYSFVEQALNKRPMIVHGDGSQTRCFTYIDDAIDAFVALIETPAAHNSIYNVGSTKEDTVKDLAEAVHHAAEGEVEIEYRSHKEAYGDSYEDIPRRVPDTSRIKAAINWEASTSLEEGIARMYKYEGDLRSRSLKEKGLA